jgi:hypothetical protein
MAKPRSTPRVCCNPRPRRCRRAGWRRRRRWPNGWPRSAWPGCSAATCRGRCRPRRPLPPRRAAWRCRPRRCCRSATSATCAACPTTACRWTPSRPTPRRRAASRWLGVQQAFEQALALQQALGGVLAVVSHGLVIRALLGRQVALPPGMAEAPRMANTSVTVVSVGMPACGWNACRPRRAGRARAFATCTPSAGLRDPARRGPRLKRLPVRRHAPRARGAAAQRWTRGRPGRSRRQRPARHLAGALDGADRDRRPARADRPGVGPRASPSRLAGPKRFQPVPVALRALPPIDLVLVSHDHYDHLDYPTVPRWPAWACPSSPRSAWARTCRPSA